MMNQKRNKNLETKERSCLMQPVRHQISDIHRIFHYSMTQEKSSKPSSYVSVNAMAFQDHVCIADRSERTTLHLRKQRNVAPRKSEQPWIGPIVRGKTKAPVEFGAKFDLSVDDSGLGRIEKISYDAYNESTVLVEEVERFRERTGHYPERLLADQIYRTRDNRNFCKLHGIRLSDPKLGRPSVTAKVNKRQEYQDNTDRIEVERTFSLSKRCYGMGCITTKQEETQLTFIALSVFVTNLFRIQKRIRYALLHLFRFGRDWNRCKSWKLQISA